MSWVMVNSSSIVEHNIFSDLTTVYVDKCMARSWVCSLIEQAFSSETAMYHINTQYTSTCKTKDGLPIYLNINYCKNMSISLIKSTNT